MTTGPTIRLNPRCSFDDYVADGPTICLNSPRSFDDYVAALHPRFTESGYVWDSEVVSAYVDARYVAQLARVRLVALNYSQIVFIFTEMAGVTLPLVQEYVAGCVQFVRERYPKPKGQGSCMICVLVAEHISAQARSALQEERPMVRVQNPASIVPVVYDLHANELIYSKRRRALHAVVWRPLHQRIEMLLQP